MKVRKYRRRRRHTDAGSICADRGFAGAEPSGGAFGCAQSYFGTVKATENCVFSHMIFNTPPPEGLLSMASVS